MSRSLAPIRMTLYTLEVQRPYGKVESRRNYIDHALLLRALQYACKRVSKVGFVVVLKNGKEISYDALRALECMP